MASFRGPVAAPAHPASALVGVRLPGIASMLNCLLAAIVVTTRAPQARLLPSNKARSLLAIRDSARGLLGRVWVFPAVDRLGRAARLLHQGEHAEYVVFDLGVSDGMPVGVKVVSEEFDDVF